MIGRLLLLRTALLALPLFSTAARADYSLTPVVGGMSSITVTPGSSLGLDVNLTSSGSDSHYASAFTVDFSLSGLNYLGHFWSSPYLTATDFNLSAPGNSQTPTTLSSNSFVATSGDPGKVDVYFANFVGDVGQFTTGKLLTINLQVPSGFASGPITIRALPESFENDSPAPITTTGGSFTLNVQTGPTARTWSGAGGDATLSRWTNWLNGQPRSNDTIVFGAGPTQKNPTNGGATPLTDVGGITFDATGYVLDSATKLTVSGTLRNNVAAAVINAPIELAGSGLIAVSGISGNTLIINGQVTGTVGLTKGGPGKAVLTQDAAYTGNTNVPMGVLEMQGLSNSGSTTVGTGTAIAQLFADYIRQSSLTINNNGKVVSARYKQC